jgi:putative endonuclease
MISPSISAKKFPQNARQKGRRYEKSAEEFLVQKGFRIIERNWQAGHQEIDLIAVDKNTIAFIEVKGSRNENFGHPAERLGRRKRQNLIKAATRYVIEKNLSGYDLRYDLVAIIGDRIEYYPDAFWDES